MIRCHVVSLRMTSLITLIKCEFFVCAFLTAFFVPAGPVVNDGGLSWLRKSYQRMKEQAEREQRSLNDVVAERYGVRTEGTFTPSHAQCGYEKK